MIMMMKRMKMVRKKRKRKKRAHRMMTKKGNSRETRVCITSCSMLSGTARLKVEVPSIRLFDSQIEGILISFYPAG